MSLPDGLALRSSAVVTRGDEVLLVRRTGLAPDGGVRTVDMVFPARHAGRTERRFRQEPGLEPAFMPLAEIQNPDLRPPLTGHLRGMLGQPGQRYAPYLASLWRPESGLGVRGP